MSSTASLIGWEPPLEYASGLCGPALDVDLVPPLLADYACEVAATYQAPTDLVFACQLGTLAAAAIRRCQVSVGLTHVEQLSLYILPTAPPGERKIVLRKIIEPLEKAERHLVETTRFERVRQEAERDVCEERIRALSRYPAGEEKEADREARIDEVARIRNEMPSPPVRPRLTIDDATTEVTARRLEEHGAIAIVSEEAGALFEILAGKYSNGKVVLDVHLKGYDGGQLRVDRMKSDPVFVEEPALAILVTPQPAILERIARLPEFRGRGLIGRCCFVLPESLVGSRMYQNRTVHSAVQQAWEDVVLSIALRPIAPAGQVPSLRIEGAALALWKEMADEIELAQREGGELYRFRDWASKHPGRAARLAGLCHLVRHHTIAEPWTFAICEDDVAFGWEIAKWLTGHAHAAYELMGTERKSAAARKILASIRRLRSTQFSQRDAYDSLGGPNPGPLLSDALEELTERGFICPVEARDESRRKRGRPPSPLYEVNPYTHQQKEQKGQNPSSADSALSAEGAEP